MLQLNNIHTEQYHAGFFDYMLILYIVITSGYLSVSPNSLYLFIPVFILTIFLFFRRGLRLDWRFLMTFISIAAILIIQKSIWGGNWNNIILPFFRYIIFYIMAVLLLGSFKYLFSRIIFVISCLSLFFWIFDYLSSDFHNFLLSLANQIPQTNQNTTRNGFTILLYSVDDPINIRNSGPFFEPGRFTIVITLALIFNLSLNKSLLNFQNVILILTDITTFSTTAYLVLIVILTTYILFNITNRHYKVILIILAVILFIIILKLDFLFNKIALQIEDVNNTNSRFGALFYIFEQIIESPWFGYGNSLHLVVDGSISSPNGLGEIIRWWGIPFSIIYFFLLFKGTKRLVRDKKWHITCFLSLLMLAFPQSITLAPLYYFICFIGLTQKYNILQLAKLQRFPTSEIIFYK